MSYWEKQTSSKLGRSIVTAIATAQTNASVTTTNFGSQTYQVRIVSTLPIWATIDTTATVTAGRAVTRGQQLNFISTSTSTGYVVLTEMT
jgi:hypothetical protein